MGLDMYIFKRTVAEGHEVQAIEQLTEKLDFVENYNRLSEQVADNGKNLTPNDFWTINNETPEEKRERLLREIPEYLSENKAQYDSAVSLLTPEHIKLAESYSSDEVAYWRKANHIHRWFVDNAQDGEDDCNDYLLIPAKIRELIDVCQRVIDVSKDESLTQDDKEHEYQSLLPRQAGFFFGGTDYDEHYISSVENTIKQLKPLVETDLPSNEQYFYSSSW